MSQYTAAVSSYTERGIDHFLLKPPTTYGVVVVRPPVQPGELFRRTILGKEWCLVDIQLLFTTGRAAVFLAESSVEDPEVRRSDIEDIAKRIGELANNPAAALRLMNDAPFAEPDKSAQETRIELDDGTPPQAVITAPTEMLTTPEPAPMAQSEARVPKVINNPPVAMHPTSLGDLSMGNLPIVPLAPSEDGRHSEN